MNQPAGESPGYVRGLVAAPEATEQAAMRAWDTYRFVVGGKAFNGDPLPDWPTLLADPNKERIVKAWRAVALRLGSYYSDQFMGHQEKQRLCNHAKKVGNVCPDCGYVEFVDWGTSTPAPH